MSQEKKGQGRARGLRPTTSPSLPPQGYTSTKTPSFTPNLKSINKNQPKSTHSVFSNTKSKESLSKTIKEQKQKNQVKQSKMTTNDLTWQGDKPQYSNKWPTPRASKSFRIHHVNVNGLSLAKDSVGMDQYLQSSLAMQIDVGMINEINLAVHNPETREKIKTQMKAVDKTARLQIGYNTSNPKTENTGYMPGGNMVWVQGGYACRTEKSGHDKYGRWSYIILKGKRNAKVVFISAYKTCMGSSTTGTGVASQQFIAMANDNHETCKNQRGAFDKDLAKFIHDHREEGHMVCLMMDANTPSDSKEMTRFITTTGLTNAYTMLHPEKEQPRTYEGGSHCIDVCLVCPLLVPAILKAGYAPFYNTGTYDHRELVVDISEEYIFDFRPDKTKAARMQLSVRNVKASAKYIKRLKQLSARAKITSTLEEHTMTLRKKEIKQDERDRSIMKLKSLKTAFGHYMTASGNSCVPSPVNDLWWSPRLSIHGRTLRYWNRRLEEAYANDNYKTTTLTKPKGIEILETSTKQEMEEQHSDAQVQWIKSKDNSEEYHRTYIEDLLAKISEDRNISYEAAQKQLYHQELSKASHARQKRFLKPFSKGIADHVRIAQPSSEDPNAYTDIHDEETLHKILLQRNACKLTEANISPFSKGPLADMIHEYGKCEVTAAIIDGTFPYETLQDLPNQKELELLMKALIRPLAQDGTKLPDCNMRITKEDFKATFSKVNEKTSCGPSGLTMPHYKVAATDDELSHIHALFMNAAFEFGFSYTEWEQSVHCMLMKEDTPYIHRLRIIQLFEGDLNGALKLLFGRRLMKYGEDNNLNSEATYGGRKRKSGYQAMARIQYTSEISRIMRSDSAMMDVDATGCFDRMPPRLAAIVNQTNGSPQASASCQAEVTYKTKHRVKTKTGVSKDYFQRSPQLLIEGMGQGSAGSMPAWHGFTEAMHTAYKQLMPGCTISSPTGSIKFVQHLLSFVDDNKMFFSFPPEMTTTEALNRCSKGLQIWQTLLNITGGALELSKCALTLTIYNFDKAFHGRNRTPGLPTLQTTEMTEGTCKVTIPNSNGREVNIKRQEPNKGTKLLGVRAAADGNFKDEYDHRLLLCKTLAGRLKGAPLKTDEVHQVYYTRYKPSVCYCLPITTFTDIECNKIQSQFYKVALPKMGMNRNMPRAVIYGPRKFGGLEYTNMATEQIAQHTHQMIGSMRRNDLVGQTMRAAIDSYQIYLGTEKQFLEQNPEDFQYKLNPTKSPITYIWLKLWKMKGKLRISAAWTPTPKRENDCAIMDRFRDRIEEQKGTSGSHGKYTIWHANACRLYMKVTMLSDITNPDGRSIAKWALNGSKKAITPIEYPRQQRPPEESWKYWRNILHSTFLTKDRTPDHFPINTPTIRRAKARKPRMRRTPKLQDAIDKLPDHYKEVLGNYKLPEDEGEAIFTQLQSQIGVEAWTDGTVKDGKGAHAYTIRTITDLPGQCIEGKSTTPGDPRTISSLRTEHYGALATVLLLQCIWNTHKTNESKEGKAKIHIDNSTVIDRITKGIPQRMTATSRMCQDYDVWAATMQVTENTPIKVTTEHVYGHQADKLEASCGVRGPLPRIAHYNEQCDEWAGEQRQCDPSKPITFAFPQAEAALLLDNEVITTNVKNAITFATHGPILVEYIEQRNKINKATMETIDWLAFEQYMNSLPQSKRIKVAKYIHDWQNVGSQKLKHHQSSKNTEKEEEEITDKCPFGCGQSEVPQHYLRCQQNPNKEENRTQLKSIQKWMENVHTHPVIRVVLQQQMKAWLDGIENNTITTDLNEEEHEEEVQAAIEEQNKIGWDQFFKGRITKKWSEIQQKVYSKINAERKKQNKTPLSKAFSGQWWAAKVIKQVVYYSLNAWQIRNNHLHKEKEQEEYYKERNNLQMKVSEWYKKQELFEKEDEHHFIIPTLERMNQSNGQMKTWCTAIQAIYNYNKYKKDRTHGQDIRNFYSWQSKDK